MEFSFVPKFLPYYFDGVKMTIIISLIAVFVGVAVGAVIYFMKSTSKINPLRWIAIVYVEIIRGTPMLLQIMMVYSGSKLFLGLDISAFVSAIIAISMNSAAYVSEIIRAGITAVDKGQMEAARSLGMTKVKAMRLVIIPQAVKNILPAIGNEFVTIIKESSMASVIGVGELMYAAKVVTGSTYKGFEPLIISAAFYFILTFSLGRLMNYFEGRMKVSDTH